MKKLLLIFSMLALFISANVKSQDLSYNLDYGQTYVEFTGAASDTFGIADSVWSMVIYKQTDKKLNPYVQFKLDSIGGTAAAVNVKAYSKVFASEDYTLRRQITWNNGADTNILFDADTIARHSRYWKFELEEQNNIFKIQVDNANFHTIETD